jgi:hypothetical protein
MFILTKGNKQISIAAHQIKACFLSYGLVK